MKGIVLKSTGDNGLDSRAITLPLKSPETGKLSKVLFCPDLWAHSGESTVNCTICKDVCHVDVMPALGTHMPMSDEEPSPSLDETSGTIIVHNWRMM